MRDQVTALIVGTFAGDDVPTLALGDLELTDATAAALDAALAALGATGKPGEIVTVPAPAGIDAAVVVAVGLGAAAELDDAALRGERVRTAAGAAARSITARSGFEPKSVATTLGALDLEAAVLGIILGGYRFENYRTAAPTAQIDSVTVIGAAATKAATKAEAARAAAIAEAVTTARDFTNSPPNDLFPASFAARAAALAEDAGLKVKIFDEKALEKKGYGGIIGVGKGSSRPPRLLRLTYTAPKKGAKTVALVGKGITFDTGGISIKPAAGMEEMTSDMGGAAAVIATVILAAKLKVDVNVTATVPMAENMPSATAQRPGDVIVHYGGITSEVLNTDAEGRLILADAIVRALEDKPDYLIDTATLTGAQLVALGSRTPGVLGTNAFRDRVATISQSVGENGWAMPMPSELRAGLSSRVADIANISGNRHGGMLVAAVYLKEFVTDDVEWAHIDVAGPAFNSAGPYGYTATGGTGVPVRTMFATIEDIAERG